MKRALTIAVALCTIGVGAFGLGTITGKWEGGLTIVPAIELTQNKLTLNYTEYGLTFGAILSLLGGVEPEDTMQLTLGGAFGPLGLKGNMYFNFEPAAYTKGDLTTTFDFAGIGLNLKVEHWATQQAVCSEFEPGANLRYTLTTTLAPFTIKVVGWDCCTGTFFYNLNLVGKGLSLCCGVTYDVEFNFLKTGFDYLKFSLNNIFEICCGISFDATITFTTAAKAVEITPKFAGFGEACFTVFADIPQTATTMPALELYGWKISCTIADCNTIEFVTALDPAAVEDILGDVFEDEEFEYVKMTFCGAGCCGGQWNAGLAIYFDNGGGLFGISRLGFDLALPLNDALEVTVAFSAPTTALSLGWVFTF
jgi:hypothetical protein